ncbi:protein AMN1 homolog [Strongylocentrotus purpuratus]|uniref:Protein AMN1 homolog n=1 Tax=Strongylocentrotus purpuratus TaxID=7668 RepID=A0A7M7NZM0_STRPU|nr:protein AMN1 homolog [Strongylocentrotus purpuratus]
MTEQHTNNCITVSSLFSVSLLSVIKQLPCFLSQLDNLPINVKDNLLHLMSKRGLLTDTNVAKVIHKRTRILDLSESSVSDRALLRLGVCRNLWKIDLNTSKGERTDITDQGIQALATSCPYLSIVYLRRCVSLEDPSTIALAQSCHQLMELNLGGCIRLSDASLQAIGQNCRMLKSLNISRTKVTDEGIFSLCNGVCKQSLKELHLNNCIHLSDEAVEAVVNFCPKIAILLFHGCPCITDRSRQALEMIQGPGSKMKQVTWTIY